MPWTGPIESRETGANGSATTIAVSPASTIPAGTLIVIGWGADVASLTATCADNSTQSGSANSYSSVGTIGATSLTGGCVECLSTTRDILSTDVITVTLSASTTRRDLRMTSWKGQLSRDRTGTDGGNTTSPVNNLPSASLQADGELVIAFRMWKGGAVLSGYSDTPGAGFTAATAAAGSLGATTRVECNYAYLTNGASGTFPTDTVSYTSITAECGFMVTYRQAPAPRKNITVVRRTWAGG